MSFTAEFAEDAEIRNPKAHENELGKLPEGRA